MRLARHRASGRVCALKALSKAHLLRSGQVAHLLSEKEVLGSLSGEPAFVRLLATFQVRRKGGAGGKSKGDGKREGERGRRDRSPSASRKRREREKKKYFFSLSRLFLSFIRSFLLLFLSPSRESKQKHTK